VRYEVAGDGPPVLLIQGVGVAGRGWAPQVGGLKDSFRLAWFDNRGLGDNPGSVGSVDDMARDALAVLDALGWESAAVVGHSLGGVIAQAVAVLAPDRVDRLAALCTVARGRAAVSFAPADLWLNLRTMVGTRPQRRRAFFELVTDPSVPATEDAIGLLEATFGRSLADLPACAQAQVLALARADYREALGDVNIPALVVSATHDRIAKASQGPLLAEVLGGEFVEVPGGHAVTVQDAERINALLREFLQPRD